MQVILLEKVRNLGNIGDQVKVKRGYARNFLTPQSKAIQATKENLALFEARRLEIEKAAEEAFKAAEKRATTFKDLALTIAVKISEEGKLFGSVGMKEIIEALKKQGHEIARSELSLPNGPIRQIGEHEVTLILHPDVTVPLKIILIEEK
ncbi:MAG: 50S ribosomal protein L9 [Gammaproteobacteria bacterium]|jgi:large subunit ribosomal protein L9